jgi:hypothetical protein
MRIMFLGKETQGGGSPTLYATDRDSYLVQGWKVPTAPNAVEIPESLLAYLQPGTALAARLEATGRCWRGDGGESATFTVVGTVVTDAETLAQLRVPEHESCVEIGRWREGD